MRSGIFRREEVAENEFGQVAVVNTTGLARFSRFILHAHLLAGYAVLLVASFLHGLFLFYSRMLVIFLQWNILRNEQLWG